MKKLFELIKEILLIVAVFILIIELFYYLALLIQKYQEVC